MRLVYEFWLTLRKFSHFLHSRIRRTELSQALPPLR